MQYKQKSYILKANERACDWRMVGITTGSTRNGTEYVRSYEPAAWAPFSMCTRRPVFYFTFIYGGQNMNVRSLEQELKTNAYPGRGIVIGETGDGS